MAHLKLVVVAFLALLLLAACEGLSDNLRHLIKARTSANGQEKWFGSKIVKEANSGINKIEKKAEDGFKKWWNNGGEQGTVEVTEAGISIGTGLTDLESPDGFKDVIEGITRLVGEILEWTGDQHAGEILLNIAEGIANDGNLQYWLSIKDAPETLQINGGDGQTETNSQKAIIKKCNSYSTNASCNNANSGKGCKWVTFPSPQSLYGCMPTCLPGYRITINATSSFKNTICCPAAKGGTCGGTPILAPYPSKFDELTFAWVPSNGRKPAAVLSSVSLPYWYQSPPDSAILAAFKASLSKAPDPPSDFEEYVSSNLSVGACSNVPAARPGFRLLQLKLTASALSGAIKESFTTCIFQKPLPNTFSKVELSWEKSVPNAPLKSTLSVQVPLFWYQKPQTKQSLMTWQASILSVSNQTSIPASTVLTRSTASTTFNVLQPSSWKKARNAASALSPLVANAFQVLDSSCQLPDVPTTSQLFRFRMRGISLDGEIVETIESCEFFVFAEGCRGPARVPRCEPSGCGTRYSRNGHDLNCCQDCTGGLALYNKTQTNRKLKG